MCVHLYVENFATILLPSARIKKRQVVEKSHEIHGVDEVGVIHDEDRDRVGVGDGLPRGPDPGAVPLVPGSRDGRVVLGLCLQHEFRSRKSLECSVSPVPIC